MKLSMNDSPLDMLCHDRRLAAGEQGLVSLRPVPGFSESIKFCNSTGSDTQRRWDIGSETWGMLSISALNPDLASEYFAMLV